MNTLVNRNPRGISISVFENVLPANVRVELFSNFLCWLHCKPLLNYRDQCITILKILVNGIEQWNDSSMAINSPWPNEAMWWHKSVSALIEAIAGCPTSTHYLDQSWLITYAVLWYSPFKIFFSKTLSITSGRELYQYRDQWVNSA